MTAFNRYNRRDASVDPLAIQVIGTGDGHEHEDGAWQDEVEGVHSSISTQNNIQRKNSKTIRAREPTSPRRRKAPIGITVVQDRRLSQSRQSLSMPRSTGVNAAQPYREPINTTEIFATHAENSALFVLHYVFDILKSVIMMLKTPIKIAIFFWVLSLLGNRLSLQIRKAAAPVCWIPGISSTALCFTTDTGFGDGKTKRADFEVLEESQSQTFHTVLVESIGNSVLALDIKRAELATTDLATLVRVSQLSGKKIMEDHLREMAKRASLTAEGLQNLAAKVNGAFDRIIAVNDHAMTTIGQARDKEPAPYSLASFIRPNAKVELQNTINKAFDQAMAVLSLNLRDLIVVAELSMKRLKDLEESIDTLHQLAIDSGVETTEDKEKVLGELWTWLGGNREKLAQFKDNFHLLRDIGSYRKQARSHVVLAQQALRDMQATMEDMRERTSSPVLSGPEIPAEVHMKSIEMGMERMKKSRLLAREIEQKAYNREFGKASMA